MPPFVVNHNYAAGQGDKRFGPWEAGDVVDLDDEDAAWVNRDSAGTLTGEGGPAGGGQQGEPPLESLSVKALVALAAERGVELGKAKTKGPIIELLVAAAEVAAETAPAHVVAVLAHLADLYEVEEDGIEVTGDEVAEDNASGTVTFVVGENPLAVDWVADDGTIEVGEPRPVDPPA